MNSKFSIHFAKLFCPCGSHSLMKRKKFYWQHLGATVQGQRRRSEEQAYFQPAPPFLPNGQKTEKNNNSSVKSSNSLKPTAFAFKIIGLYFINKPQKIVGNIRYFLFKKSLLRIAPSFRKVRKSGVCEGNGGQAFKCERRVPFLKDVAKTQRTFAGFQKSTTFAPKRSYV